MALRCDVSDEAAVERGFAETVATLGRIDACFVNAGVCGRGPAAAFAEMTDPEWHRVMASTSTARSSPCARPRGT